MILRARWTGDPPEPGHYLCSMGRHTKYAYKVIAVEILRDHPAVPGYRRMKLRVERMPAADLPADDVVVHPWKWDPRKAGFNKR